MATAIVRFYQNIISDGNMRTLDGAKEGYLGVESLTGAVGATVTFAAAPSGCSFCTIETDGNTRFTSAPTAQAVEDTSSPLPAAAFVEQGPIYVAEGYVVQARFY